MFKGRCINCLWWDNEHKTIKDKQFGYCRKHKPVVYAGADSKYHGGFPLLDKEDFCGEYREA